MINKGKQPQMRRDRPLMKEEGGPNKRVKSIGSGGPANKHAPKKNVGSGGPAGRHTPKKVRAGAGKGGPAGKHSYSWEPRNKEGGSK